MPLGDAWSRHAFGCKQMSSSIMPHCLRFVGVGRRSYVELSRKLILNGSICARVGQLRFLCSASSQHDQAHCLANTAAVADLFSSSMARTSSVPAQRTLCTLFPRPALLPCTAPTMYLSSTAGFCLFSSPFPARFHLGLYLANHLVRRIPETHLASLKFIHYERKW